MLRAFGLFSMMVLATVGCGGSDNAAARGGPGSGRGGVSGAGGSPSVAAVPIKVQPVTLGTISQHIETNGTLEAENEVDIVARTTGPITELLVEEGDHVRQGELLARLDDREARNQVAIAEVAVEEAQLTFDRAQTTFEGGLVSREAYDAALSALETAKVQLESAELQLDYTEVRAPFVSQVAVRYVKRAEYVSPGTSLFRVTAFNPLLCRIEVPEKDLGRLAIGQRAHLEVEAFADGRFDAEVTRIRPTLDATTGTVTVTLEVDGRGRLRPGMFARVYLEIDRREGVVAIPKTALVLDSIGDTVFVNSSGSAERREVELGYRDGDRVEVVTGLAEGDELIVLGQDGLAEGTPVTVLDEAPQVQQAQVSSSPGDEIPEDRLEHVKERMRERGLSEEQIDQRLEEVRSGQGPGSPGGGPGRRPGGPGGPDSLPPRMVERIREASPEDLERIKARMQQFGMSEEQVDDVIRRVREGQGQ